MIFAYFLVNSKPSLVLLNFANAFLKSHITYNFGKLDYVFQKLDNLTLSKLLILTPQRSKLKIYIFIPVTTYSFVEVRVIFRENEYKNTRHLSDECGVHLKAHTALIGRVLYDLISYWNEHRLHIIWRLQDIKL